MKKITIFIIFLVCFIPNVLAKNSYQVFMNVDEDNNVISRQIISSDEKNIIIKKPTSGDIQGEFYGYNIRLNKKNINVDYEDKKDSWCIRDRHKNDDIVIDSEYTVNYKKDNSNSYFVLL